MCDFLRFLIVHIPTTRESDKWQTVINELEITIDNIVAWPGVMSVCRGDCGNFAVNVGSVGEQSLGPGETCGTSIWIRSESGVR